MDKRGDISGGPQRIKAFAHFFKLYMGVSAIVTAALPIPIASFRLIPGFKELRGILATYTSLFCFLCLGFICKQCIENR